MMRKLTIALVAISALTAGLAFADEGQKSCKHEHVFNTDSNKDGVVTREEFKAANEKMADEHFKRMDTNGDGKVDQAERKTFHERMRQHRQEWQEKHPHTTETEPAKALEGK